MPETRMAANRVGNPTISTHYSGPMFRQYRYDTSMKICLLTVVLLLSSTLSFAQTGIDFLGTGRDYTDLFYEGKSNEIWLHLSPAMKNVFGSIDAILGMHLQMQGQFGEETQIVDEQVIALGESIEYNREVMFQKIPTPVMVQWIFDGTGVVIGFSIKAAAIAPTHFTDYRDKADFRLPFKGNWLILSGGDSLMQNQHATSVDQRFAYDITMIQKGRTFSGDGSRPNQHFCFGRPILAPGSGTIVEAKDGIPDNMINAPFASPPEGNHVIIDHGNSEYSVLAHLKLGSVKVKAGDKVVPGSMIGRCGNSGNSPVPHLHIHLQNTPVLFEGEGLPMQFQNYVIGKKPVDRGEPDRGEIIRNKSKK
jgi:hypothetical protein